MRKYQSNRKAYASPGKKTGCKSNGSAPRYERLSNRNAMRYSTIPLDPIRKPSRKFKLYFPTVLMPESEKACTTLESLQSLDIVWRDVSDVKREICLLQSIAKYPKAVVTALLARIAIISATANIAEANSRRYHPYTRCHRWMDSCSVSSTAAGT